MHICQVQFEIAIFDLRGGVKEYFEVVNRDVEESDIGHDGRVRDEFVADGAVEDQLGQVEGDVVIVQGDQRGVIAQVDMVAEEVGDVTRHIKYPDVACKADGVDGPVEQVVDVQEEGHQQVVLDVIEELLGQLQADRLIPVLVRVPTVREGERLVDHSLLRGQC